MIDARGDRARYQQLADLLRQEIKDGTYPPGSRLPTESALRRRHDVGGMTIKRALALLREEGLIVTRRGEPPLVRRPTIRTDLVLRTGDRCSARMPTGVERVEFDVDPGVPLLEVRRANGMVELFAA